MNQTMRSTICFLLVSSFILQPSSFLRADGGAVRLSERQGNYRLTVFTAPTPVRAGPVRRESGAECHPSWQIYSSAHSNKLLPRPAKKPSGCVTQNTTTVRCTEDPRNNILVER